MLVYLRNGARWAVLIGAEQRTVEVYRAGREPAIHAAPRSVALDPELAGFERDPGPIFEAQ